MLMTVIESRGGQSSVICLPLYRLSTYYHYLSSIYLSIISPSSEYLSSSSTYLLIIIHPLSLLPVHSISIYQSPVNCHLFVTHFLSIRSACLPALRRSCHCPPHRLPGHQPSLYLPSQPSICNENDPLEQSPCHFLFSPDSPHTSPPTPVLRCPCTLCHVRSHLFSPVISGMLGAPPPPYFSSLRTSVAIPSLPLNVRVPCQRACASGALF